MTETYVCIQYISNHFSLKSEEISCLDLQQSFNTIFPGWPTDIHKTKQAKVRTKEGKRHRTTGNIGTLYSVKSSTRI